MSCAVFTILGMWVLYANKTNTWALQATFGLAVFCLFWACFLAWRDKYHEVQNLRSELNAKQTPTPMEEALRLSEAILEFVFDRTNHAPQQPAWRPSFIGSDPASAMLNMAEASQQQAAYQQYAALTLQGYQDKFGRKVDAVVAALKTEGICDEEMGDNWTTVIGSDSIRFIGNHLAKLADLARKPPKT